MQRTNKKAIPANERRMQKRADAEARQLAREDRSDREQLQLLIERGHGHCSEAMQLRLAITNV